MGGGTLCLGSPFVRLGPGQIIPPVGSLLPAQAVLAFDFTALPIVLGPGSSVHFQYWYTDPAGGPGGNLTNSLVVVLCR